MYLRIGNSVSNDFGWPEICPSQGHYSKVPKSDRQAQQICHGIQQQGAHQQLRSDLVILLVDSWSRGPVVGPETEIRGVLFPVR